MTGRTRNCMSHVKKKKAEEDVTKAEEMRRQYLETFKETQRRKESETPLKKKRASGSDTMNYLKEVSEAESKRRAEELELRRKEMEKQSELQREELKMRKQELDDKRNQNEAMHQQMMMQQQQLQLLMQQQQQQSTIKMALLEKALAAKKLCLLTLLLSEFVPHVDSYDVIFFIGTVHEVFLIILSFIGQKIYMDSFYIVPNSIFTKLVYNSMFPINFQELTTKLLCFCWGRLTKWCVYCGREFFQVV